MLIVPIDQAKPGVKLAMAVMNPQNPERQLLNAGYTLDERVLERLAELGVPAVYVDYPGLDDLDKLLMPSLSRPRQQMYQQIKRTFAAVEKTAKPSVTFPDYYAVTRELVLSLMQQGSNPIYMDLMSASLGGDDIAHSAAVAHLSLTLGIRLEQYLIDQRQRLAPKHAREVVNLGVGGMLHDIGKARIDPRVRAKHAFDPPEGADDQAEWESHAQIGYDMIHSGVEPSAAAAVMHHHQRYDGAGFPCLKHADGESRPLAGDRIHVFARIVAAADLFERLTLTETGRRRTNLEILHLLRTEHAGRVDPQINRALPGVIPPFPPGTRVSLSDGTAAIVTGFSAADPYQPTVRRIGADNWNLDGPALDLSEMSDLSVGEIDGIAAGDLLPVAEPAAAVSTGCTV